MGVCNLWLWVSVFLVHRFVLVFGRMCYLVRSCVETQMQLDLMVLCVILRICPRYITILILNNLLIKKIFFVLDVMLFFRFFYLIFLCIQYFFINETIWRWLNFYIIWLYTFRLYHIYWKLLFFFKYFNFFSNYKYLRVQWWIQKLFLNLFSKS